MSKTIELDHCPRCLDDFEENRMSRVKYGVKWCWLCSFDLEEGSRSERNSYVRMAKEKAEDD